MCAVTFCKLILRSHAHVHTHALTHMLDLINLTNDPHCSMVSLADLLFERLKNTSWVVVFKDLITTHNLMTLGNEVSVIARVEGVYVHVTELMILFIRCTVGCEIRAQPW